MSELPAELQARINALGGSPLTSAQQAIEVDAYRRNPVSLERALASAEQSSRPTAYFVAAIKKILLEELARPKPMARRHDLDAVACLDCGDTGFVILTRDVGPEALAGDAAPCHCSTGQQKQARYTTIHYTRADFEPAVPDPTVEGWSLKDYALVEMAKGKELRDPHLNHYLARGGPHTRQVADEIGWNWDA